MKIKCLRCDEAFAVTEFATYTVRGKVYRRTWCRQCYNAYERPKARARYHARKAREGQAMLERIAERQRARMQERLSDPVFRAQQNAKNARWAREHQHDHEFQTRRRASHAASYQRLKADPVRYAKRLESKRAYARRKRAETPRDNLGQSET